MEAVARQARGNDAARLVADLPGRVIVALDHFSDAVRDAVRQVAEVFARGDAVGTRMPDPDPYYLLRATPDVLVIVRRDEGAPVMVEDVVWQKVWDHLAADACLRGDVRPASDHRDGRTRDRAGQWGVER
jgi:hypothetical protein